MIQNIKKISLIAILFLSYSTNAQCPTADKLAKMASKVKSDYGVSTQSRTGALKSGESYEMSFISQRDYDYRITVGTFDSDAGETKFEVYEMVTEKDEKGNYAKVKKTLISSEDAESNTVEIITDKARKLIISVSYESNSDGTKPECIGVLIEDKKTTKIGL